MHHDKVADVLLQSKGLIQSYLVGLLIEAGIVAALNATALLILGIKYAILIGIIGAILNIIPYIGGIIAISLAMIMALITMPPSYVLFVFIAYLAIQFLDNNFLVPKIVASKLSSMPLSRWWWYLLAMRYGEYQECFCQFRLPPFLK